MSAFSYLPYRTIALVAIAVIALGAFTGCSGDKHSEPAKTPAPNHGHTH